MAKLNAALILAIFSSFVMEAMSIIVEFFPHAKLLLIVICSESPIFDMEALYSVSDILSYALIPDLCLWDRR